MKVLHVKQRNGSRVWYGRWRDPISGSWRELSLPKVGITTERDRARWAEVKAEEIRQAKRAQALGASGAQLEDAVEAYLAECRAQLRPATVAAYTEALRSLRTWLEAKAVIRTQDLLPGHLWQYRTLAMKKARKPSTVHTHLARLRPALTWWRRARWLPRLTSDDIEDACRGPKVPRAEIEILQPQACKALLGYLGTVEPPSEEAIAFVALALLTGMRRGELERLSWEQVRLEAKPKGEIRLGGETKTKRGRTIDLSVSPAAKAILAALPRRGPFVFRGHAVSRDSTRYWRLRPSDGSVPPYTWQTLRRTCGTLLTCAPGIFGSASVYRSARQLGHSVQVAERHYLDVLRGLPRGARSLEAAIGAVAECKAIAERMRKLASFHS